METSSLIEMKLGNMKTAQTFSVASYTSRENVVARTHNRIVIVEKDGSGWLSKRVGRPTERHLIPICGASPIKVEATVVWKLFEILNALKDEEQREAAFAKKYPASRSPE